MTAGTARQEGGCAPAVSVVLCTFNRAGLLAGALEALAGQEPGTPPYEVLVIDNNSSDGTREVVERAAGPVRYDFEPEQGLAAARNRGVAAARAEIVAFTDDDVRVAPDWVRTIARIFAQHPDVDMAGGRVEPEWEIPPPSWLARAGVAPLALVDYGNEPFRVTSDRAVCLVGANLCIRRHALSRAGPFSTAVQRVGDGIGSTEDHELERRLLAAGSVGLYDPRLVVRASVPSARLTKAYHRAWHAGHGRCYAVMRDPDFEPPGGRRVLGVPVHVYRRVLGELWGWACSMALLRRAEAFRRELRLRFLLAFARQRLFGRT